ncbi:hexose phosphate transport protein [Enterobacter asburiae]|uniref:Hexose phosphate transport protein n=1 Tax=Enterobacter asburiae TaxID=61645 RepID=A0A376FHP5_ENTAS|nr:hexose phosphate transport protein [Enterobacter asburiae]
MLAFLNQVRKPTLDLPLDVRRKMWFKPFMQSYLVVFIGYLTMYLIRKNFNIAQNDMISTYGLSMTQLGMIGLGFSITYGVGKTVVSYYADGKNTKQFLPFMLILSAICMLGFSASMGAGSVSLFMMIAFYALSGFFQSTGGSCSYSTITKWTPRRKRGSYLGMWNISHNLGGAGAAGVALFGANYLFDGHVIGMFIFPVDYRPDCRLLSACATAATPRNLTASAKPKSCSGRRSAKRTKRPKKTRCPNGRSLLSTC